jgi:hypothetical protein
MPSDSNQGQLASLIISIIILIIVIILIVIVCCNYNTNNTNTNQPRVQNPQALAAAAMYKNNQGMNAGNAIKNNPQRTAALGAGAYKYNQNKNNFVINNPGSNMSCKTIGGANVQNGMSCLYDFNGQVGYPILGTCHSGICNKIAF